MDDRVVTLARALYEERNADGTLDQVRLKELADLLEKAGGKNAEIIDLICSLIHSAESNEPITKGDEERLGPLALQIDCWLPTMRGAFTELVKRVHE